MRFAPIDPRRDPWLPAAVEHDVYEGMRWGDEAAFLQIAVPLQPVLLRLAGLTSSSRDDARAVVADTWGGALRALGMFTWHTPLATWIASGVVQRARARAVQTWRPPSSRAAGSRPPAGPGPADWSDLPWAARWEGALEVLAATRASLPLATRAVLHVHDVERWSIQRGCDVLGRTDVGYRMLLDAGHRQLRHALVDLVGDQDDETVLPAQLDRVGVALGVLDVPDGRDTGEVDELALAAFQGWRRDRGLGLTPAGWRSRGPGRRA